jgi:hypothetical protein
MNRAAIAALSSLAFKKIARSAATRFGFIFALIIGLVALMRWGQVTQSHPSVASPTLAAMDRSIARAIPLGFEANQGQVDARVRFISRGAGHTVFLTSKELVVVPQRPRRLGASDPDRSSKSKLKTSSNPSSAPEPIRIGFVNANPQVELAGVDLRPGTVNHFIGKDRSKWRSGARTYSKVRYHSLYPGIDLVYYHNGKTLECDFNVAALADPSRIRLSFAGEKKLAVGPDGSLIIQGEAGELKMLRPVVYQERDGLRQRVDGHFVVMRNQASFALASYDRERALVIDPSITYASYLGGGSDEILGVAYDSQGYMYATGFTFASDFPLKDPLPGQSKNLNIAYSGDSGCVAFVSKFSPGGGFVYSTYLGGTMGGFVLNYPSILHPAGDIGNGIASDSQGNAYVTGVAVSTDFPTTITSYQGNSITNKVFVAKLSSDGSSLVYSTVIGPADTGFSGGTAIAVDASGIANVTGYTASQSFPVTPNAFQMTNGEPEPPGNEQQRFDSFLVRLSADGSTLLYSTYFGGSNEDIAYALALDQNGNSYIAGSTRSSDLFLLNPLPGQDFKQIALLPVGFVAKFASDGTVKYSTYLGGANSGDDDRIYAIAVDNSGAAYVAGGTSSNDFPTTPGAFEATNPNAKNTNYSSGFVAKIAPDDSHLVYATYIGGIINPETFSPLLGSLGPPFDTVSGDLVSAIAVDGQGHAFVTGRTDSSAFPRVSPLPIARGGVTFNRLVGDTSNPSRLFAANNQGLFLSTDAGITYNRLVGEGAGYDNEGPFPPGNMGGGKALAFAPSNAAIGYYAGIGTGPFETTDSGLTWTNVLRPLCDFAQYPICLEPVSNVQIQVDSSDPRHAVMLDSLGGVYVSTDGLTFGIDLMNVYCASTLNDTYCFPAEAPNVTVAPESVAGAGNNAILIVPNNSEIVLEGGANGLFRSTDGGFTFRGPLTSRSGQLDTAQVTGFAYDALSSPARVYIASRNNNLFVSSDDGFTFAPLPLVLPESPYDPDPSIATDNTQAEILYLGFSGANYFEVIKSTDGGMTFGPPMAGGPGLQGSAFAVINGQLLVSGYPADKAFIAELSSDGTSLGFSSYLGGSQADCGFGIALQPDNSTNPPGTNLVVGGATFSRDILVTQNAAVPSNLDPFDAPGQVGFVEQIAVPFVSTTPTSTPTPTATASAGITPTATATATSTMKPSATPTRTSTPIGTQSATRTPTGSGTPTPTPTATPSSGSTSSPTPTPIPVSLTINPKSVNFGPVRVNQISSPKVVQIRNKNQKHKLSVSFEMMVPSAGFAQTSSCTVLPPNNVCSVSVTFQPSKVGISNGTLMIIDNVIKSPQIVKLRGRGK